MLLGYNLYIELNTLLTDSPENSEILKITEKFCELLQKFVSVRTFMIQMVLFLHDHSWYWCVTEWFPE